MMLRSVHHFLFGTLRGRLIISVAAVHAVMMTVFVSDLTLRQRAMLLDRQEEEARALSQALATSAAGWIAAHDIAGLQELVDIQREYPELLFAILADDQGCVLAHTDHSRQGFYLLDLPPEVHQTLFSRTAALVDVATPALLGDRHVGWARIGIGQKVAAAELAQITRNGILYALAAICVGSLIAWMMGRAITRRLYAVQQTINSVRAGNRMARSSITGADEAAMMAREFNSMLEAIAVRDADLYASEEKYRGLIQRIHAAVVVHGADTQVLTSNLLAQQLLGLTEEQMRGKTTTGPDWHFFREDGTILPIEEYPVNRVLNSGESLRDVVLGVHRPGTGDDVWVLVNADPVLDGKGTIAQVIVTFVDISAHRRAEQALKQIEWMLARSPGSGQTWSGHVQPYGDLTELNTCRVILDAVGKDVLSDIVGDYLALLGTSSAVYETNGDYAFGIFSSGWCRFLDQSSWNLCRTSDTREALSSGKWLCHESCWTGASRVAIQTGRPVDIECAGGIRLYAVPIRVGKEIVGSINIGYGDPPRDAAKLRELAATFGVSETELRGYAEAYESRPPFIIEQAKNRLLASARLIGEIVERKQVEAEIKRLSENLEQRVAERTADLQVKGDELRDSQRALVNLVEDLNERTAELEAANAKLKDLERLKSLFIASMSHELRTPLNSIIGFSSILLDEWIGPLTPEQKENLASVLRAGKHLLALINDVIDVTKIEAGKLEVATADFDLHDVITEAVAAVSKEIRDKGLGLIVRANHDTLHTDRRRLLQCLLNLVSNAVKFTEKGSISVCAELTGDGKRVEITVGDTGIGVREEDLRMLFSPFVRLPSPLGAKSPGTGLGLYLTKKLTTEVLQGEVAVSSVFGEGSRFVLRLPRSI